MARPKHTIEEVRDIFSSKGYTLLSKEFERCDKPLQCLCVCGRKCELTLLAVKRHGSRCKECQYENAGKAKGYVGRMKITQAEAKEIFAAQGCELLEEYKGCQTKVKYRCICGKEAYIRPDHFKNGKRCCGKTKIRISLEEMKKVFADNGCELLIDVPMKATQKVPYRCKCGKISHCSYSVMKCHKSHCRECGKEKNRGTNCYKWIKDRETLKLQRNFSERCRKILRHTLSSFGKKKEGHCRDYLGYSGLELQERITSHPNWNRVKDQKWHLDHIFPIKAFIEHEITDIKLINHLDNLQPITELENSQKNCKYDKQEFLEWVETKKI